jgi:Holliday junction DNA helicase RuvA
MYDFVHGRIASKTPTQVVVDVNGLGYHVEVSLRTSERLPRVAQPVHLLVHFKVQEDRQRLFGFADEDERELFRALIGVSGIGPAHALALLSGYEPADIWRRIRDEDAKGLARTKGIGPKTAQRLCVELGDKAKRFIHAVSTAETVTSGPFEDAISALLVLGYTEPQARKAAELAIKNLPPGAPLEDVVREALRNT